MISDGVLQVSPGDTFDGETFDCVLFIGGGVAMGGCVLTDCDLSRLTDATILGSVFHRCLLPPQETLLDVDLR